MRITIASLNAVLVLALQWLVVILVMRIGQKCQGVFADFDATLPSLLAFAVQVTQPVVLVPIAATTTVIVLAGEVLLPSRGRRFLRIVVLAGLFAFTCFCFLALALPLITIVEKLR